MKELSQLVEIYPISELPHNFTPSDIGSKTLKAYPFLVDHFTFEPTQEESPAGILYNCNKELTADLPEDQSHKKFKVPVSSIIRYRDTLGNNILVGSRELPAKVTINPNLTRIHIIIKCNMLHSPY